jgi:hypothetical protein
MSCIQFQSLPTLLDPPNAKQIYVSQSCLVYDNHYFIFSVDGVRCIGLCVSGQKMIDLLHRVEMELYPVTDKIILLIGTNDILQVSCTQRSLFGRNLLPPVAGYLFLLFSTVMHCFRKQKSHKCIKQCHRCWNSYAGKPEELCCSHCHQFPKYNWGQTTGSKLRALMHLSSP